MAAAGGTWSKGKFYSAKMQAQLSEAQREKLNEGELDMSASQYAKRYSRAHAVSVDRQNDKAEIAQAAPWSIAG